MSSTESSGRVAARDVLYDKSKTEAEYVECYQTWAKNYENDMDEVGLKTNKYALERLTKHLPRKDALILDYNGGTGIVGKKLMDLGYTNLHISDGSSEMLKIAKEQYKVYKEYFCEVVNKGERAKFLEGKKYDCILACSTVSQWKSLLEQIFEDVLNPGGIYVSIEGAVNIENAGIDGPAWVAEQAKIGNPHLEVIEDSDHEPFDDVSKQKARILVVRKV